MTQPNELIEVVAAVRPALQATPTTPAQRAQLVYDLVLEVYEHVKFDVHGADVDAVHAPGSETSSTRRSRPPHATCAARRVRISEGAAKRASPSWGATARESSGTQPRGCHSCTVQSARGRLRQPPSPLCGRGSARSW